MTAYVNSVQQVSITIASGSTTGTASVTAAVGTFFLIVQGQTTSATTSMAQGLAYVTISGTTLTATRTTSSTNAITVNVAVVDATSSLVTSVQMGTIAITTGTSKTATISSVTTGNSVVALLGFSCGNATFDWEVNAPVLSLTNATTVTATVAALSTSCTVGYCVIQFAAGALNQNTQFFSTSWTNNALTTTQAITSVNVNNSMLIYAGSNNGNTTKDIIDQQRIQLTNATTVTVTSGFADGDTIVCNFWAVEFIAGVLSQNAQRGAITLSATTSNTATITSANTSLSLCNYTGMASPTTAITSLATVLPRLTQTSATVLTTTLNSSGSASVGYEVLTFTGSSAAVTPLYLSVYSDSINNIKTNIYKEPYVYNFVTTANPPAPALSWKPFYYDGPHVNPQINSGSFNYDFGVVPPNPIVYPLASVAPSKVFRLSQGGGVYSTEGGVTLETIYLDKWKPTFSDKTDKYVYRNFGISSFLYTPAAVIVPSLSGWLSSFPDRLFKRKEDIGISRNTGLTSFLYTPAVVPAPTGPGSPVYPNTAPHILKSLVNLSSATSVQPVTFSSGPLILKLTGDSNTVGVVQAYNDGVVVIPNIPIDDAMPVRRACIQIIKKAGLSGGLWVARPYKLIVQKNNVTIFTIRSLYFGTRLTIDENNADWVILDHTQWTDILS